MPKRRVSRWMLSLAFILSSAITAIAQEYPAKPIRIVTATPGGAPDIVTRLLAEQLAITLGQRVIVDNRFGLLAIDAAVKAPPDGYTLLLYGSAAWVLPLMQDVSYDAVRDLSPVTMATSSPNVVVVHPSLPAKSVRELIALAKARPGELNLAGGTVGSSTHLAAELFNAMAAVNIVRIPYKGTAQSLTSLMSGELQLMFALLPAALPHVDRGKLRALAVTSARRSALGPGLPTIAESGVPGYEATSQLGMFAPAKTSPVLVNRLSREIVLFLGGADLKQRLFKLGLEAVGSSPQEFSALIKAEMEKWDKLIKTAGLRAN